MDRKRVVLVVEDDTPTRSITAEYLRNRGLAVIEAVNADEAAAVLAAHSVVDLVFTDVIMPGSMSGLMLAQWMGERCPKIPILMTSGASDIVSDNAANRRFLPKPYELKDVEIQIRRLLGSSPAAPNPPG